MTHPTQSSGCREAIQLLAEHGFDGLAEVIELLLNEVGMHKLRPRQIFTPTPSSRLMRLLQ